MNDEFPNSNDYSNSLKNSVEFKFPGDAVEEKYFDVGANEVINQLCSLLFSAKKPKVTLAALLYCTGVDVGIYLGVENIETAIAEALGESKQNFNRIIKEIRRDFNITHFNRSRTFAKHENKPSN